MKLRNNILKKFGTLILGSAVIAACTDLSGINERLDSLDSRVQALETQVNALNESIKAVQAVIQDGTVITSIEPTEDGYIITTSETGEDGSYKTYTLTNGTVGNTPLLRINENGNWEVSYNNGKDYEAIMTGDTPASAQGIAPQFQISSEGYWQVCTDGSGTFKNVTDPEGKPVPATGESGSTFFKEVKYEDGVLKITMAGSDTPIEIPVISGFSCTIADAEGKPVSYDTPQIFGAGETRTYKVTETGVVSAELRVPSGWKAVLGDFSEAGEAVLSVTAPSSSNSASLTKVTADTEKDITIHAINKDGLSLFAKMQVEVIGGPVPSMTVTPGETSFNSLSFTISDVENLTSYIYALYPATSPAPTQDALLSSGTKVDGSEPASLDNITSTADGAAVTYGTSYTLYVLPVNDNGGSPIYGNIITASADTPAPETYSELYEATGSITIAGVTYSKDTYGYATVLEATEGNLEIKTSIASKTESVIVFLKASDYKYILSSTTDITSEIIIVGDSKDRMSDIEISGSAFIKLKSGSLVMKNINMSSVASVGYLFNNADATANFDKLHMEGCRIDVNKNNLLASNVTTYGYKSIKAMSCTFNITNTTNTVLFNYNNSTVTDVTKEFIFENNTVYSATAKNAQILNYGNSTVQTGTVWEAAVSVCNNTFYNVVGSSVYVKVYQIGSLKIQRNIFWAEPDYDTASYCIAIYSSSQSEENLVCSDNIAYGLASGKNWAASHSNSTVAFDRIEKLDADPLEVKDTENGIFTPSAEYSGYGAQR